MRASFIVKYVGSFRIDNKICIVNGHHIARVWFYSMINQIQYDKKYCLKDSEGAGCSHGKNIGNHFSSWSTLAFFLKPWEEFGRHRTSEKLGKEVGWREPRNWENREGTGGKIWDGENKKLRGGSAIGTICKPCLTVCLQLQRQSWKNTKFSQTFAMEEVEQFTPQYEDLMVHQ